MHLRVQIDIFSIADALKAFQKKTPRPDQPTAVNISS